MASQLQLDAGHIVTVSLSPVSHWDWANTKHQVKQKLFLIADVLFWNVGF